MDLIAIDIGGTTIKFATWEKEVLKEQHAIPTPANLDLFYEKITAEVNKIKKNHPNVAGVGISSPGAVDQKNGIIGGSSAIPIQTKYDSPANMFTGLRNLLGRDNVKSQIIKFNVEFPDENIQKYLCLKHSEPVYNILRLRIVDDSPLIIEHTYMPVKLVPNLDENILHKSIYQYIHKELKLKFGHAYRKIRACKADQYDQKYLNAKKSDPMLELEQIVWLTNGDPIEYSTSRNRYDQRDYTIVENNRF